MTTVWDERLITRSRAADIAGPHQVRLDTEYIRCAGCDMNILRMTEGALFSVDDIIASTVRHLATTAHAVPLSGKGLNDGRGDPDGSAIDLARSRRRSDRASDLVH